MADLDELPELQVFEPLKSSSETYATIHDVGGRQVGSARGTAYGRGEGIQITDIVGRPVLDVHRRGLKTKSAIITDPAGNELAQVVTHVGLFSGQRWELFAGGTPLARSERTRRGGLHISLLRPDGAVLASIDGSPSVRIMFVDSPASYVLKRFHPPDRYWGMLELGAIFAIDASVRAANNSGR